MLKGEKGKILKVTDAKGGEIGGEVEEYVEAKDGHNLVLSIDLTIQSIAEKYLKEGKNIALVSDAGTPIISDPGYEMAKYIIEKGYNVVTLPGATAFVPALGSSGLTPSPFMFYGFLNSKEIKRKKELQELKNVKCTLIFYEASHRIVDTINNIWEIMGNRKISISREISKKYEQIYRGTCETVLKELTEIKGEFVVVVEYSETSNSYDDLSILDHIEKYISEGYKPMDAIKVVSKERNLRKSDVYNEYQKGK